MEFQDWVRTANWVFRGQNVIVEELLVEGPPAQSTPLKNKTCNPLIAVSN